MCGIAGLIGASSEYIDQCLPQMVNRMLHRGPDGQGIWKNPKLKVGLGHTRLAIVDTSDAGAQPMHLADQGLHLVVNGEIYNYPQLRDDLEKSFDIQCASHCDSEIILHGYAHYGHAFFERLNGMFAFALVDQNKNIVHIVRDRLGIKPVYMCQKGQKIVFSSEIKSLIAGFDVSEWEVDHQGLNEYLCYQTPMDGRTLFKGIELVKPGHHVIIDLQKVAIIQYLPYWSSLRQEKFVQFKDAAKSIKQRFQQSVERHLLSDVPVAATLSAGFDSASVTAQASRIAGQGLDTYTGAFYQDGGWYDETQAASELTSILNGKHHVVNIGPDDFLNHFDDLIYALDEPRMGMGVFPQYMVARAAANKFKVILTGHGGDELFSGYPIFKLARKNIWLSLDKAEIPHLVYFAWSKIRSFLSREYGQYMPVLWNKKDREKLFGHQDSSKTWSFLAKLQAQERETGNRIFQIYLNVYLPSLLAVEDKISMAHSIESRTPLLDNEMLKLSLSLPQDIKLHKKRLKALIKENAKHLLPEIYFKQPKRGFPTPLRQWLRGPLEEKVIERLQSKHTPLHRIMDAQALTKWVKGYQTSWKRKFRPLDEIQSHQMWQLLSLDSWMRGWEKRDGIRLK